MAKIKTILVMIALLLNLGLVSAVTVGEVSKELSTEGYVVVFEATDDTIMSFEEAEFEVNVRNRLEATDRFRVRYFGTEWDIRTDPASIKLSGLKLLPKENITFKLILTPAADLDSRQHAILLDTEFEKHDSSGELDVRVNVLSASGAMGAYVPTVSAELEVDEKVDPRDEYVIKLTMDNLNRADLEDMLIDINSNLIDEEIETSLDPLEKGKVVTIRKSFDPKLEPQDDELTIVLKSDGRVLKTFRRELEVVDYTEQFKVDVEEDKGFLKKVGTLTYTNTGNSPRTETVKVAISSMKKLFTRTSPRAQRITDPDGQKFLAWELDLDPGESSDPIRISTSYRLLALLVLIALGYYGWKFATKSPLIIIKEGENLGGTEGIGTVKVTINVKNPTNSPVKDLSIVEKVPNILDVVNEFKLGTLRPSKVLRHEKEGTSLVKWEIETLDPYEDRLLTYKIKPQLSIVGDLTLPPTTIRYTKNGKKVTIKSGPVVIKA